MILNAFLKGAGLKKAGWDFEDPALWQPSASFFGTGIDPVTGKQLTEDDIFACSVMWRGLNLIADSVAKTTLVLKRRLERGSEIVTSHPSLRILNRPTEELTWFNYVHTKVFRYYLYGNAYDQILRDGNQTPARLNMLHPAQIKMYRNPTTKKLEFHYYNGNSKPEEFQFEQVHWVRGPSANGIVGLSHASFASKAIMRLRAYDEYATRYFTNDATPPVVIMAKKILPPAAKDEIRRAWEQRHKGVNNSWRVGILDNEMDAKAIAVTSNRDSELSEQQRQVIADIARFLGVPLHMLAELTRSTNNNISTQSAEFLYYCLDGILTNFQQSYTRDFLRPEEQSMLYFEHDVADLLWADPAARREHVGKLVSQAVLTPNEGREELGKPPVPGGDVLLVQGAMVTLDGLQDAEDLGLKLQDKLLKAPLPDPNAKPGEETDKKEEKKTEKKDDKQDKKEKKKAALAAFEKMFVDQASRLTTRLLQDYKKVNVIDIANWAVPYYLNKQIPDIKQAFRHPVIACLHVAEDDRNVEELIEQFAHEVAVGDQDDLRKATKGDYSIFDQRAVNMSRLLNRLIDND